MLGEGPEYSRVGEPCHCGAEGVSLLSLFSWLALWVVHNRSTSTENTQIQL